MMRLDSDLVRKELAGLAPEDSASTEWNQGLYTPEWNDRTYAALCDRAEEGLFQGHRVAVEASFREEKRRLPFVELARSLAVPCLFLECHADDATIHERLARRSGDVSDADIGVYESAKQNWESTGPRVSALHHIISTDGDPGHALEATLSILKQNGLA